MRMLERLILNPCNKVLVSKDAVRFVLLFQWSYCEIIFQWNKQFDDVTGCWAVWVCKTSERYHLNQSLAPPGLQHHYLPVTKFRLSYMLTFLLWLVPPSAGSYTRLAMPWEFVQQAQQTLPQYANWLWARTRCGWVIVSVVYGGFEPQGVQILCCSTFHKYRPDQTRDHPVKSQPLVDENYQTLSINRWSHGCLSCEKHPSCCKMLDNIVPCLWMYRFNIY